MLNATIRGGYLLFYTPSDKTDLIVFESFILNLEIFDINATNF